MGHLLMRLRPVILAVGIVAALFGIVAAAAPVYQGNPERGELAASGVTGTTGGSANTVLTLSKQATCLSIENTMPVEIMVTRGSTDMKRVPASAFRVLDFGTNAVALPPATVIKTYATGATGSTGYVEVLTCSSTR